MSSRVWIHHAASGCGATQIWELGDRRHKRQIKYYGLVLVGVVLCLASRLSNCKLSESKANCLLTKCPLDQSRIKHKQLCVSVVPTEYVTAAEACCAFARHDTFLLPLLASIGAQMHYAA